MKQEDNIIQIRQRDIRQADKAFAEFMEKTENYFNKRSQSLPNLYKNIDPNQLEALTLKALKEISPSTPFRAEEIQLVSGHKFPDIIAETYFGVEVKSTKSDKWVSTGSSIVESTRNMNVDNIYMFFGKLGGNPPQFRCRPYQDCLSNIAVTHSPRYMIDMELSDKRENTIFDKLNVPYNDFCRRDDKIELVREYYIKQALSKEELPWWVGNNTMGESKAVPSISLMSNCPVNERDYLKAQMLVLFPEVISGNYKKAALWLCTCRYLLDLSFRDSFSAGGQWKYINGRKLKTPLPAVIGTIMGLMPLVKKFLSSDCSLELYDFNKKLFMSDDKFETWLDLAEFEFKNKWKYIGLDVKDLLRNYEDYELTR